MRIRRRERGFSLIEMVIAMTITAMIVPGLIVALYQFIEVTPKTNAELIALNEVRQTGEWITSDAAMALSFDDTTNTFAMTGGNVSYSWDAGSGDLIRIETGANTVTNVVSSNVSAFDMSPDPSRGSYVVVTMTSTVESRGENISEETTVYALLRRLSGGWLSTYKTIYTTGGEIAIHADVTIEGSVRAYGEIKVNAGGNITENAEATGDITIAPSGYVGGVIDANNLNLPPPPAPLTVPVGDVDFIFGGGGPPIVLDNEDVWLDPPTNTQLKPGIYYAPNRTIKLTNDDVVGEVTIIGRQVDINSKRSQLTPHYGGILAWGTKNGPNVVQVMGSADSVWEGVIYAPDGQVRISADITIYGGVAGKEMDLSASGGEMLIVVE